MSKRKKFGVKSDSEMMKKILKYECGEFERDDAASDELEYLSEYGEDIPQIGESEYFSTARYTMIPTDDDTVNCQGS